MIPLEGPLRLNLGRWEKVFVSKDILATMRCQLMRILFPCQTCVQWGALNLGTSLKLGWEEGVLTQLKNVMFNVLQNRGNVNHILKVT
jgi:hypothetical protein